MVQFPEIPKLEQLYSFWTIYFYQPPTHSILHANVHLSKRPSYSVMDRYRKTTYTNQSKILNISWQQQI